MLWNRGEVKTQSLKHRLTVRVLRILLILGLVVFGSVYLLMKQRFSNHFVQLMTQEMADWEKSLKLPDGADVLKAKFQQFLADKSSQSPQLYVTDANGNIILSAPQEQWQAPSILLTQQATDNLRFEDFSTVKGHFKAGIKVLDHGEQLIYVRSIQEYTELLEQFLRFAAWSLLVGAVLGAWLVSRMVNKETAGLQLVNQAVERISLSGRLDHKVLIETPVAELRQLGQSFNRMQIKIEGLIRELKQVSSNIAHDLRGPLTRIKSMAQTSITAAGGECTECSQLAHLVLDESNRLVQMIQKMMDIAEAESGVGKRQVVNLQPLVLSVAEDYEAVAEYENMVLKLDIEGRAMHCQAEPASLIRIVSNLLENAFKYSEAGGTVRLQLRKLNNEARLLVIDEGCGIPKEDLPHIFERFYRGDHSRSTPGNGLGLSLVKATCNSHGFEIEVKSQVGVGSTFELVIPLLSDS